MKLQLNMSAEQTAQSSLEKQTSLTNLHKGMVEELASCPSHLWVTFQAMRQKIFPFWAYPVWDGRFMTHSYSVHDLEVVFKFMPGPLKQSKSIVVSLCANK